MKYTLKLFLFLTLLIGLNSCSSIQNEVNKTVKIWGNCGMCKQTIEQAANKSNEVEVSWDPSTKYAQISYDSKQTNLNEILKRIADAGYDNERFKASEVAYEALHTCCQYDRK